MLLCPFGFMNSLLTCTVAAMCAVLSLLYMAIASGMAGINAIMLIM